MSKFIKIGERLINMANLLMLDAYEDGEFCIYLSNGVVLKVSDSDGIDAEGLRDKLEAILLGQNIVKFKSEFDV